MTFPRWIELPVSNRRDHAALTNRDELARLLRERRANGATTRLHASTDAAALRDIAASLRAVDSRLRAVAITGDIHANSITPDPGALWPVAAELGVSVSLVLMSSGAHDAPSSPRGDVRAARLIVPLLDRAVSAGVPLALEPRAGAWLQRVDDAVRLGMRINRDELGLVFRVSDWRACDNEFLEARIDLAIHRLHNVVIDPADEPMVTELLARRGYTGPVTLPPR